jgi:hypothetical protein
VTTGNICPVCGYDDLEEPAYSTAGAGSHEICYCCGFQYGYTDDNLGETFDTWRQRWIDDGMRWDWGRSDDDRPEHWDPVEQLKNLDR